MKKVKHYISQTKNIESTNNLTVVMPPVFEVSAFKLILKYIFAVLSLRLAQYSILAFDR